MSHDVFLKDAVERYKGFLHLIRRNRERSLKRFCVPTYDVDLIWHTHQLHPVSYCQDVSKLLGKVLEHDDMDSDRTKGKKLDTGFSGTTAQWEETYGRRYWKAGAMYRGNTPSAVTTVPLVSYRESKEVDNFEYKDMIQLPEVKNIEVVPFYHFVPSSLLLSMAIELFVICSSLAGTIRHGMQMSGRYNNSQGRLG